MDMCVRACVRDIRNRASKINNSIIRAAIFSIAFYMYLVRGKIIQLQRFLIPFGVHFTIIVILKVEKY